MSRSWHGGKGDRPRSVNQKKWDEGWRRVFGGQKKKCKHPGCRHHISHPCEECGYQGGQDNG